MANTTDVISAIRELTNTKQLERAELLDLLKDGLHAALVKRYGPNVRAATALLACNGHMSIERAADLMGVLLDAPVSAGFAGGLLARVAACLAEFEGTLKQRLRASPVLHHDETPARVAGDDGDRLLAQRPHRRPLLPHPLLPGHRPQPRHPPPRRPARRHGGQSLDAPANLLINHRPEWIPHVR